MLGSLGSVPSMVLSWALRAPRASPETKPGRCRPPQPEAGPRATDFPGKELTPRASPPSRRARRANLPQYPTKDAFGLATPKKKGTLKTNNAATRAAPRQAHHKGRKTRATPQIGKEPPATRRANKAGSKNSARRRHMPGERQCQRATSENQRHTIPSKPVQGLQAGQVAPSNQRSSGMPTRNPPGAGTGQAVRPTNHPPDDHRVVFRKQ